MKTKSFRKKLVLNKSTIDDLNRNEMKVHGGVDETHFTVCGCDTDEKSCYPCPKTFRCPLILSVDICLLTEDNC
jgi:hypothetical protein